MGFLPVILQSPSLAFWLRINIQRAGKVWLESDTTCAFEQFIYFSGPLFPSCLNWLMSRGAQLVGM